MQTIEVSDENYNELRDREFQYHMTTLNDVITKLLRDTDVAATTASLNEIHKKDKVQAIKKSTDVRDGYLWQTFAKTLPNFPYDFREVFDVHGSFPSPIDAIAFPGLANDNITAVHLIDYQLGKYLNGQHKRQVKNCVQDNAIEFRLVLPQDVGIIIPEE